MGQQVRAVEANNVEQALRNIRSERLGTCTDMSYRYAVPGCSNRRSRASAAPLGPPPRGPARRSRDTPPESEQTPRATAHVNGVINSVIV